MYGLNSSLSIAAEALNAQSGAIAVTNNNIANVDTVGYTRQIVNLSAEALAQNGSSTDNGVSFNGYTSVRDQLLNISINNQTSQNGSLDTQSTALSALQTAFSGTTTGIGASMSALFSSISALSTSPTDSSARQSVLSAASSLASAFNQGSTALTSAQSDADSTVASTVASINGLTQQIASLNAQIASVSNAAQSGGGGSLTDQRDEPTSQLAALTGVSETQTEGQPTLTTSGGTALVVGAENYPLHVATGDDGLQHVIDADGQDITSKIDGGTLGGALTLRDSTVPGMVTALNTLVAQFVTSINDAQASGYDQNGNAGQPMFGISASGQVSVTLANASGIAASSDSSSSGSSGNVGNLLAVQTAALPSGDTPANTYASFVSGAGTAASDASTGLAASKLALTQLTGQQSAESGVSVDEETTNLIKYQQAYTAAANVVSTVNDLFTVVMNMVSQ